MEKGRKGETERKRERGAIEGASGGAMKYYVVAIKVTLEREPGDGKRNARPVRLPCSRLFLLPSCRSRDESGIFCQLHPAFDGETADALFFGRQPSPFLSLTPSLSSLFCSLPLERDSRLVLQGPALDPANAKVLL